MAPAVAALKRGEVIVYPTETLYGLGADALERRRRGKSLSTKGPQPRQPHTRTRRRPRDANSAGRRGSSARRKVDGEFLARPFDFDITGAKRGFPTACEFLRRYRRAHFQ